MIFGLDRSNKYVGKRVKSRDIESVLKELLGDYYEDEEYVGKRLDESGNISNLFRNRYIGKRLRKSNNFTINIVAGILSGVLVGSSFVNFIFPVVRKLGVSNLVMNSSVVSSDYNGLSKEDANEYVVNLFCDLIDKSDEFSFSEKDALKENISLFLGDWGYLYNKDSLVNMETALYLLDYEVDESLTEDSGVLGMYMPFYVRIVMDDESNYADLSHEVTHTITTDLDDYLGECRLIDEAISSCIDREYYDNLTYIPLIRDQIFFLSEIIGRENLLSCYVNSDYDYLSELIGEDNKDLLDMFEREYKAIRNGFSFDSELVQDIAVKMRNMYEDKYGHDVSDDAIVYAVYMSCLPNNSYEMEGTLFYNDNISFEYDGCKIVLNVSDRNNRIEDFSDYLVLNDGEYVNNVIESSFDEVIRDYNNGGVNNDLLYRMSILFREDVCYSILNSDDSVGTFMNYLRTLGISDDEIKIVTYKFVTDCVSDEEYAILYGDKFKYLYDNGRLDFAVSDIKLLSRYWGNILGNIVSNNPDYYSRFLEKELDYCSGFYWEDRKLSYDDSVIGYNATCVSNGDKSAISIYDNGISYEYTTKNGVIYPDDIYYIKLGYISVSFDTDEEVYVYGNRERLTCKELGISISNGKSR